MHVTGAELSFQQVPKCLGAEMSFQRMPKCLGAELSFSTGAEMSWCRTVLFFRYLRTQTFYIPKRKYAYKHASITKCLTCSPREM